MTADAQIDGLFSVRDKVALVTGGSSGIGYMIASGLVQAGADVYIAARRQPALEQACARLSDHGRCSAIRADVATGEGVDALAAALREREDRLDILVNNAGATWGKPLEAFPDEAWDKVHAVNVKGPFMLVQRLLPLLKAAGTADDPARVINIGSIYGMQTDVQLAYSYAASKAAVHQLSRVLARELAPSHVHVNAIAPGLFPSNMTAFILDNEQMAAEIVKHIPAGRTGRPDDIAGLVIFLSSRAGAFLTGAVIPLDGGSLIAG